MEETQCFGVRAQSFDNQRIELVGVQRKQRNGRLPLLHSRQQLLIHGLSAQGAHFAQRQLKRGAITFSGRQLELADDPLAADPCHRH